MVRIGYPKFGHPRVILELYYDKKCPYIQKYKYYYVLQLLTVLSKIPTTKNVLKIPMTQNVSKFPIVQNVSKILTAQNVSKMTTALKAGTLLLFEGIEGIPMCAMFFPLDFEGKIH